MYLAPPCTAELYNVPKPWVLDKYSMVIETLLCLLHDIIKCKLEFATHVFSFKCIPPSMFTSSQQFIPIDNNENTADTSCLVTLLTCHANQTEYFAKPNDRVLCPGLPCHTLSHYMDNMPHCTLHPTPE